MSDVQRGAPRSSGRGWKRISRLWPSAEADPFTPVSRQAATLWNLVFLYGGLALVLVRNLGMVPLYLSQISVTEYGAWLASGAVLMYVASLDLGLMAVLSQQVAASFGARQRDRLERLLGTLLWVCAVWSVAIALAGALLGAFVPRMLGLSGELATRLIHCILIASLANGFSLLGLVVTDVMRGLQRPVVPGLVSVLSDAASLVVTVALLRAGAGLYSIAYGLVVRSVGMMLGGLLHFLLVPVARLRLRPRWSWRDAKDLWRLSIYNFVSRSAGRTSAVVDPFVIGLILGPHAVAVYGLTTRATEMIGLVAGRLGEAVLPSLAHLGGEAEVARVRFFVTAMIQVQVVTAAIGMGGVIAFNASFVALWVGPDNFAGPAVTVLYALWSVGYMLASAMYNSLFAMGEIPRLWRVSVLDLAVRLPLLVAAVSLVGMWGAPAAALAAIAAADWLLIRYLGRRLGVENAGVRRVGRDLLGFTVGSAVLGWLTANLVGTLESWWLLGLAAAGFLAACALLLYGTNRELVRFLLGRARSVRSGPSPTVG